MISFKKSGGDHKMRHYTEDNFLIIISIRNNNAYFSKLKFNHKVADVMIKSRILKVWEESGN